MGECSMFLYDMKEKNLNIYELTGDIQAMKDYRLEEMSKIPEEERIFIAEGFLTSLIPPVFEFELDDSDFVIPMEKVNNNVLHKFKLENPTKGSSMLTLANYISGGLSNKPVVKVKDSNRLRYFLISEDKYQKDECYRGKVMKGIIEIPESLYLLQLLEQEKFTLIGKKNIKKQLCLFEVSSIEEISLDMMKKSDSYAGNTGVYEKTLAKAQIDKNIIKYLKR